MDVKIIWSEEPVGYGVVVVSGYNKTIVTLHYECYDGAGWGWSNDDLTFDGFPDKATAQQDALGHFINGRSNYFEFRYGIKE